MKRRGRRWEERGRRGAMNRAVWQRCLGALGPGRGLGSWLTLRRMQVESMDCNLMVPSSGRGLGAEGFTLWLGYRAGWSGRPALAGHSLKVASLDLR